MATSVAQAAAKPKKPARRKRRTYSGDRVGQGIAITATIMAAGYIVIRGVNWIRFL